MLGAPATPQQQQQQQNTLSPHIDIVNVKIMILGAAEVGKSMLFARLVKKTFSEDYRPTAGIDFATHMVKISSGRLVKAQIVDTSGLERFRPIIQSYWALATGALVVYDITNRQSFLDIRRWITEFRSRRHSNSKSSSSSSSSQSSSFVPTIMVVGTKAERANEPYREVSAAEAQAYALAQGFYFMEVSALENTNVELAFGILLTEVYHAIHSPRKTPSPSASSAPASTSNSPSPSPSQPAAPASTTASPSTLQSNHSSDLLPSSPPLESSSFTSSIFSWALSSSPSIITTPATDSPDEFSVAPTAASTIDCNTVNSPLVPPASTSTMARRSSATSFWSLLTGGDNDEDPESNQSNDTTHDPDADDDASSNVSSMDGAARAQAALAHALRSAPRIPIDDDEDLLLPLSPTNTIPAPSPAASSSSSGPLSPSSPDAAASKKGVPIPPRRQSIRAAVAESGVVPTPVVIHNHHHSVPASSSNTTTAPSLPRTSATQSDDVKASEESVTPPRSQQQQQKQQPTPLPAFIKLHAPPRPSPLRAIKRSDSIESTSMQSTTTTSTSSDNENEDEDQGGDDTKLRRHFEMDLVALGGGTIESDPGGANSGGGIEGVGGATELGRRNTVAHSSGRRKGGVRRRGHLSDAL